VTGLLTPQTIDALLEHDWPGNVRELANVMEHAYIISGGNKILPDHLPYHLRAPATVPMPQRHTESAMKRVAHAVEEEPAITVFEDSGRAARTLHDVEMEHVLTVLEKHGGNKPAAAAELGISLKTLYNKLNQMQEERKTA
jgi:DNA-binding NtrC family response regulator